MNADEIQKMPEVLNVTDSDILEMEKRLINSDVAMNQKHKDGGDINALDNFSEMQNFGLEPSFLLEVKHKEIRFLKELPPF